MHTLCTRISTVCFARLHHSGEALRSLLSFEGGGEESLFLVGEPAGEEASACGSLGGEEVELAWGAGSVCSLGAESAPSAAGTGDLERDFFFGGEPERDLDFERERFFAGEGERLREPERERERLRGDRERERLRPLERDPERDLDLRW